MGRGSRRCNKQLKRFWCTLEPLKMLSGNVPRTEVAGIQIGTTSPQRFTCLLWIRGRGTAHDFNGTSPKTLPENFTEVITAPLVGVRNLLLQGPADGKCDLCDQLIKLFLKFYQLFVKERDTSLSNICTKERRNRATVFKPRQGRGTVSSNPRRRP